MVNEPSVFEPLKFYCTRFGMGSCLVFLSFFSFPYPLSRKWFNENTLKQYRQIGQLVIKGSKVKHESTQGSNIGCCNEEEIGAVKGIILKFKQRSLLLILV